MRATKKPRILICDNRLPFQIYAARIRTYSKTPTIRFCFGSRDASRGGRLIPDSGACRNSYAEYKGHPHLRMTVVRSIIGSVKFGLRSHDGGRITLVAIPPSEKHFYGTTPSIPADSLAHA